MLQSALKVYKLCTTAHKKKMEDTETEHFDTCSESSRQITDAPTVATELDILPNYLISTSKPLEMFNADDEFEESGELGTSNDSDYDADDLDEHRMAQGYPTRGYKQSCP